MAVNIDVEMTLAIDIEWIEENLAIIDESIERLQACRINLNTRLSAIKEEKDSLKIGEFTWKELLDANGTQISHNKLIKRLNEFCLGGLDSIGYWPDTQQRAIQVKIFKGASTTKLVNIHSGLLAILPHITTNEDGYRQINLMEHTLSEFYSWTIGVLGYNADSETHILQNNYEYKKFPTLMDALIYCKKHHWY